MISTYVISLDSSDERRTVMRDHLDAVGVPFLFFDAVDGRKMSGNALMKAAPKGGVDYCGMLTAAEIGCALSHLAVIREIAEGQDEYAAVLEDDIFLLPEARKFFGDKFLSSLPAFDILQLGGVDSKQKSRLTLKVGNVDGYQICTLPRCHYSMGALIYTREAARLIGGNIKKITAPIDNMIFFDCRVMGLRIIEVRPPIVRSNANLSSVIGARRGPDRFFSKVDREFRRIRNWMRRWRSFVRAWGLSSILRLRPT
jgi:GR25 family glycosyltransferase involved in LPS biosynthesis